MTISNGSEPVSGAGRLLGRFTHAIAPCTDLHSREHALLVKRGLHVFYRRMALVRLLLTPLWGIALTASVLTRSETTPPEGNGIPAGWFILVATGVCAIGALAAWAHHHDRMLDWMADRPGLRGAAGYLQRTARTRRVALDIPGLTEGIGVLAISPCPGTTTPSSTPVTCLWWRAPSRTRWRLPARSE